MGASVVERPIAPAGPSDIGLDLPEPKPTRYVSPFAWLYGADDVAATYCGFDEPPAPIPGHWKHGWTARHLVMDPDFVVGYRDYERETDIWVARKDEEEYLKAQGVTNARAIGLPILYVTGAQERRRPGSLLVMPVHSLDYTEHTWQFDTYADEIAAIRSQFREVVVCVHPSCWKKGYWVDAFRERGFAVVTGALGTDANALRRMRVLFSSFECVTSNGYGSHLAYAAYFGARPSIFGTFAAFQAQDFARDPLYGGYPDLLNRVLEGTSEGRLKREYPLLFAHPAQAGQPYAWGAAELGHDNRLSPRAMCEAFGWPVKRPWARMAERLAPQWERMPRTVRHLGALWFSARYRHVQREIVRLGSAPPGTPVETDLLGPRAVAPDARAFIEEWQRLVVDGQYEFIQSCPTPTIVLVGAGAGVSVWALRRTHPYGEIVALEPNPAHFEALKRNLAEFGLRRVRPIGPEEYRDAGLAPYLPEIADLLAIDRPGRELAILTDIGDRLAGARNIIVEYASVAGRGQDLDAVLALLTSAGFRYHLRPRNPSSHPLVWRDKVALCDGTTSDMRTTVFAWRPDGE